MFFIEVYKKIKLRKKKIVKQAKRISYMLNKHSYYLSHFII